MVSVNGTPPFRVIMEGSQNTDLFRIYVGTYILYDTTSTYCYSVRIWHVLLLQNVHNHAHQSTEQNVFLGESKRQTFYVRERTHVVRTHLTHRAKFHRTWKNTHLS